MPLAIRTAPCPLCRDSAEPGWLCEDHPGQPWQHAGCGGAGMRCVCNPAGTVQWAQTYAEVPRDPSEPLQ
ncbi:MAG: hypothetical protein ACJ8G7_21555 [Rhizobacter sp.]